MRDHNPDSHRQVIIHVTSCETHAKAWRHQEHLLAELWEKSSRVHQLTRNPSEADIIIVGNIREEDQSLSLRRHPVIGKYPNKCYAVDERDDWPSLPFLPGVYASAHRKLPLANRYCSGSYALYHKDFKNPYVEDRNLEGYSCEKRYLASFAGRRSHKVRDALLNLRPEDETILLADTSTFNLFTHTGVDKSAQQERYSTILTQSKFAICPRGAGASSVRLFEAMKCGVAPVIISDDWIVPVGPDWESFSISIKEAEIDKVEPTLLRNESRYREMGRNAEKAYGEYFAPDKYFDYLIEQILLIRRRPRLIPQSLIWGSRDLLAKYTRWRDAARRRLTKR